MNEDRIRIKFKNKEFSEFVDVDRESASAVGWFMIRLNRHRIDSVVSKLGIDSDRDKIIGMILDYLLVDVLSDEKYRALSNDLFVVFQNDYSALQSYVRGKYF